MIRDESILKRILNLRSIFVINLLILFGVAIGLGRTYWNNYQLKKEIKALEKEARELEAENIEIGKLKSYFESKDFLEEEARLKLGLQKPGEETVIVQDAANTGEEQNRENYQESRAEDQSKARWLENPKKWWQYFFD